MVKNPKERVNIFNYDHASKELGVISLLHLFYMNEQESLSTRNISLWALSFILGGALIDWSLRNAHVYNLGIGSILTFTIFGFILGASGPFPLWILLYNKIQDRDRLEATVITFKINNTFTEWLRVSEKDLIAQEAAGITTIFRGVSQEDPKKVIAIYQAKRGIMKDFLQANSKSIASSGQVSGSEETSIYYPNG